MMKPVSERTKVSDEFRASVSRLMRTASGENVRVEGRWRIVVRDAETMQVLRDQTIRNVVCTPALTVIASRMATPWSGAGNSSFLDLGTGAGSPAAGDTDLFTPQEASWVSTERSSDGAVVTYYHRYMPEDANGLTYTEAGIWDELPSGTAYADRGGGTLMNHIMVSPSIEKTAAILVDFYVTFTFS